MPYTITLTITGPPDVDGLDIAGGLADHLVAGVAAGRPGHGTVTYSSDASDLPTATRDALHILIPPGWTVDGLEVLTDELFDAELARPAIPDLVGIQEIADMMGRTRQRAGALAQHPQFPTPAARLAAGPVYTRHSVQAFLNTPRPSGRPKVSHTIDNAHRPTTATTERTTTRHTVGS